MRARRVASGLLGVVAGFQVALAAGAPWGAAAWGGGQPGALPAALRRASAGSAVVHAGLAVLVATEPLSPVYERRLLTALAGVYAVGTAMNAASPSRTERLLWTPVAAGLAASLWATRRDRPAQPPGGTSQSRLRDSEDCNDMDVLQSSLVPECARRSDL